MTDMGRCGKCRWWDEREDAGVCSLLSGDIAGTMIPEPKAWVFRGGGPRPILFTAPDFGCVQFEAKA